MEAAVAYRACATVTRRRAANFYYGIRLLPRSKRRALCAVYAFARRVDDLGDGRLPAEEKLRRLAAMRAGVAEPANADLLPADPVSADPVLLALADARTRFPLPLDAFADLIDGVEMDVRGIRYETFDDLVGYCRRVAGSIGRLSVAIFGAEDLARASALADDLGVAMQLTNVLRDVREDAVLGRTYLPSEDLNRFGVSAEDLRGRAPRPMPGASPRPDVTALLRFEAARARSWFARGLELRSMLDGRSASCVSAMTGIYRRILARIERRPEEVLRRRVALPAWEKAWIAGSSLAGARS